MDKILLPTDGSNSALMAAKYIVQMTKLIPDLQITVLAVEEHQLKGEEAIERTRGIFDQAGIKIKIEIYQGRGEVLTYYASTVATGFSKEEVGDIIAEYANDGGYDMIIMGRRGLSTIQGFLLGSVSEKVIKKAKCPVTIVPVDSKLIGDN